MCSYSINMTATNTVCTCGEATPHVIAKRETADGIGVWIWHDGAITGRHGRALPGVPITRPRTAKALELARITAYLISGDVEMYDCAELPRLYACARRVAARGGSRRDLCAALVEREQPVVRFAWCVYATDSTGAPTVRVARLDRIRWPGLVVWHERGRYELLVLRTGIALGARSHEALEPTGFSFGSQRELGEHLLTVQPSALRAVVA